MFVVSCQKPESAPVAFERSYKVFVTGDLEQTQERAHRESERFRANPEWAWKFRILEARAAIWRGNYDDALKMMDSTFVPPRADLLIPVLALESIGNSRLHQFSKAELNLKNADELCAESRDRSCGEVLQAHGLLANDMERLAEARRFLQLSRTFAQAHGDTFLESTSLLNLSTVSLKEERFGDAIDWSMAALESAHSLGAGDVALAAEGNLGWASFMLGDLERALPLLQDAEKQAAALGDVYVQENELTNMGYIYMAQHQLDLAARSFQRALELSEGLKAKQDIYNALRVLARWALQEGNSDAALAYAHRALQIAHDSGIHSDELYPLLVRGQVLALRGDFSQAQQIFESVERDSVCPIFLKWEAQHSLARLYEDQKDPVLAEREYRAALNTFESARATLRREDLQFSFLTNAVGIYDDYLHLLVKQGSTEEALDWADYSRGRTLSEGLGLLSKQSSAEGAKRNPAAAPKLNLQSLARRANGTILFYWLGEKQSYLWAITPQQTRLFTLPPGREIEASVKRYRAAFSGPSNVLESSTDGAELFRILVAPAQSLMRKDSRVFIVPDGELNNLNFETLISPLPAPHYWIEDVDVVNTPSLRILSASLQGDRRSPKRLLLIGDSTSPSKDYPELPKAADQMSTVERHFAKAQKRVFQREYATPSAYLDSNPRQFSYIHFVAHGTASRLDPLDSAIVLSKEPNNPDSFKLYAREITQHRIHAELVTISACYSAGDRHYSGEGMVGLAWAFIRAGSRNVVAALWEVTDVSTDQLMDRFYDELSKGATPDAALRAAKLALLREGRFRSPFYWAPLQLFRG